MKCCVLMPVYNAGKPLHTAIESVLAQNEPDFEFLIIDDCSRDESADTIRQYAARDARIRAIFQPENRGLAATLNTGLAEARTELVARMDQDDESLPHRLTTQLRFMQCRPEIAVAGSFVYHMSHQPRFDRLVTLPTEHDEIVQTLPRHNCIYHPSVMLRRSKILALGGYRLEFKNTEDLDLWLRAGRVYRLANIPLPLLRYRFSTQGMTLGRKWQQMFWIQMATLSHQRAFPSEQELVRAAHEALAGIDKQWFLQEVAIGTIQELAKLRLWGDAIRVFFLFARDLSVRRNLDVAGQLAASAASALLGASTPR